MRSRGYNEELQESGQQLAKIGDLAERLGVGVGQAWKLYKDGKIPGVQLGPKTVRFCVPDVLRAIRVPAVGE